LAGEGVRVAIASRSPETDTIKEIEAKDVRALKLCVDVSREEEVFNMAKQTIDLRPS